MKYPKLTAKEVDEEIKENLKENEMKTKKLLMKNKANPKVKSTSLWTVHGRHK